MKRESETSKVNTKKSNRHKNPWVTLGTREIYKTPWIRITESDVLTPAKTEGRYSIVHFQNIAVGVVALDSQDRVLMVGQYRYALNRYSWELPEGGCPLGTSPLATARRELKEETGYRAKKWSKLLTMHLSNSSTDERAEIFFAEGLEEGEAEPEETESLVVRWVPFEEVLNDIRSGEITDAITIAAILHVALMKASGQSLKRPQKRTTKQRSLQKATNRGPRNEKGRHAGRKESKKRR